MVICLFAGKYVFRSRKVRFELWNVAVCCRVQTGMQVNKDSMLILKSFIICVSGKCGFSYEQQWKVYDTLCISK
jgi:hypothetical protein